MKIVAAALAVMIASQVVAAQEAPLRPVARGDSVAQVSEPLVIRPKARVAGLVPLPPIVDPMLATVGASLLSPQAVSLSLTPELRPKALQNHATQVMARRAKGQVCKNKNLQGTVIQSIPGRLSGCGVRNPVKIRSVSGIPLSTEAVMDCTTANALAKWVDNGLKPAVGSYKGGVTRINVAAHYVCRTRNNQAGAKISEHGRGKAIDISGFRMGDGSTITLLKGWNAKGDGKRLKKMHKRACGIFGTVLGPNSNRFHRDHFHFDTAAYRSGAYCR